MPGTTCRDNDVTLLKAGVATGNNKADVVTSWPGAFTSASYGGAADLWGAAWTPNDINNANFGVQISALATSGASAAEIDYVQITVTYTLGGAGHSMTMMGLGG